MIDDNSGSGNIIIIDNNNNDYEDGANTTNTTKKLVECVRTTARRPIFVFVEIVSVDFGNNISMLLLLRLYRPVALARHRATTLKDRTAATTTAASISTRRTLAREEDHRNTTGNPTMNSVCPDKEEQVLAEEAGWWNQPVKVNNPDEDQVPGVEARLSRHHVTANPEE
jgi:hypothetical protein